MRVHIKLAKPISTKVGQFAECTGDFDPQTGICWLEPVQGTGRAVPAGFGIHPASGFSLTKLPEKVVEAAPEKKPVEKKAAAS